MLLLSWSVAQPVELVEQAVPGSSSAAAAGSLAGPRAIGEVRREAQSWCTRLRVTMTCTQRTAGQSAESNAIRAIDGWSPGRVQRWSGDKFAGPQHSPSCYGAVP